jgi:hypothetical protein
MMAGMDNTLVPLVRAALPELKRLASLLEARGLESAIVRPEELNLNR